MRGLILGALLVLSGVAARAEGTADQGGRVKVPIDPAEFAERLPEGLLDKVRANPFSFIENAAEMVAAYGSDQGLGPEGIEWMIADTRAEVRAQAVRQFLEADLDNDQAVTRLEAEKRMVLVSQGKKGKLDLAWRGADGDGDDRVVAAEIAGFAESAALNKLSEEKADLLRAYMLLDLNGDGSLKMEEVIAATAALQDVEAVKVKQDL